MASLFMAAPTPLLLITSALASGDGGGGLAEHVTLLHVIPFAGLLLSIAILPTI